MTAGDLASVLSSSESDSTPGINPADRQRFEQEHQIAETELVFGLVGPLGTDIDRVSEHLHLALETFHYTATEIRLSALLRELRWDEALDDKSELDKYIWNHMDAGNRLRREWKRSDALALLGIASLMARRNQTTFEDGRAVRRAWIIRQLKTPREVETLRNVYGSRFFLIAAYAAEDERLQWLDSEITKSRRSNDQSRWDYTADELLKRDQSERDSYGQDVRDTFHRADLFIDASNNADLQSQLERLLEIVMANPFRSPTTHEFALFEAAGAARMSAEPGRQVGAALVNDRGDIVCLGTNEVPRPGGGVYGETSNDPDIPDQREFRFGSTPAAREMDTNDRVQREIAAEIAEALNDRQWLRDGVDADELLSSILSTRLGDLTEFGRAMHAEMSAILDAARNGRIVAGCSLYVTTFPCHSCARHIVGAGIRKCVFLAPYAKSQAGSLHTDALTVGKIGPAGKKVPFEPFVGVAPRRYSEFFDWNRRKDEDGKLFTWDRQDARPRFRDEDAAELRQHRPAYRVREYLTINLITRLEKTSGTQIANPTEPQKQ